MGRHVAKPSPAPDGGDVAGAARASRFGGRRAKLAAAGAGVTALAVSTGFVLASGAVAATPAATFAETSAWDGGYVGQYTIHNAGSAALVGWTVQFTLPAGSSVSSVWNGAETAVGQRYTVTSAGWNGTVASGAGVSFGFEAVGNGLPVGCEINGASCTGSGTATGASPSASASASASVSVTASPVTSVSASPSATRSSASAVASATTTAPSAPGTSGAFGRFAPYDDLSLYPMYALSANAATEGTKFFNLAFVTDGGSCTPKWGGVTALSDPATSADIAALRSAGGDVRVSFGGEAGTELAADCSSPAALAAAYQQVVTAYSAKYLDFDIEGAAIAGTASINRRNQAIALLEAADSGLQISYTLPVLPSGLTAQGVALLSSAKTYGVALNAVNVMAMDYGSSFPGDMATLAEQAATATAAQVQSVWPALSSAQAFAKIAVTPMIGVNDTSTETFTLADAAALASWAQGKGLAWLSFWSAARDTQCAGGAQTWASATCSSVLQSAGAFGRAMSAY